ncbi:hypothetical protein R3P38DRAFT_2806941 [Favolaschia claudopus]|uniref:Uncharacterized protein n=1 Tax=Favolaschia claudopus TaxID=2862362 RepID=A0AAV9ZIX4_9AGAR
MGTRHRFTAIPFEAREAIVVKLFRNEPLDEEDDDTRVLVGECKEIIHPSHLPRNGQCSRNHYRDGGHAIAELEKRTCDAKLSLFIPIDPNDLRAVIIPLAGLTKKVPLSRRTTLGVDQSNSIVEAAALEQDLEGRMVQELHPGMLNNLNSRMVPTLKQAQGLADVIILRQMNCNSPPMHFDDILKLIWKTCLVHFNRGVFGLRDHVTDEVLQYLLSFPHLTTSEDIQDYYTFCAESTNPKVQGKHWDLTPNDTNPIEGSHAQDNQIKPTSRPLLEAILLAKDLDAQTARIIEEMVASGVLENPNNSLQARFKLKAQRQARAQEKRRTSDAELITRKESRNLQSKMKATQQENEDLRKQIALLTQASAPSPSNSIIDVDALSDSDDDFDYAAALKSNVMSPIFKKMARDYAMPGVDDESN